MNIDHFGMDTITLAGPLEAKLRAIREAGFTQVMLNAGDLVGHPGGEEAAVREVRESGLRVTGFQVLRDFEGLSGHLHAYKLDVAKAMLQMCRALGSTVLLACSSTSAHATGDGTRSSGICESWRSWRFRTASASPTRRSPGAVT